MARSITVAQVADRWAQRGANSGDTVKAGVNAVTESPMEKAAAAKQRYLDGVNRAVQSGKYEERLRAVSLADWRKAMIDKGIPNMRTGYEAGKEKFRRFMEAFLPYVREGAARIRQMRKGTLQDSIDRCVAMIKHNAAFRGGGGGGFRGDILPGFNNMA